MFLKNNYKAIIKIAIVIICVGMLALAGYLILKACGFTTKEDFIRLRNDVGNNIWFWAIIVALQVFQVIFIPISNQIISVPIALIFNDELWKVFLASWVGIEIGTIILYFIGRFGGAKLLGWVLGDKEKVERCSVFLRRGKGFYIAGMIIGFIPDDILTVLAGTSKYDFVFTLVTSAITRGICVATSVWGFGILTRYWWGWIIIGAFLILLGFLTVFMYKWQKRKEKQNEQV